MTHEDYDAYDLNNVEPSAVSKGITFTCGYLNDYPFEIPLDKLTFSVDSRGVFVRFTCLCGRTHESTIDG